MLLGKAQMKYTSAQHRRIWLAILKNAAAPELTLPQKRELQAWAKRFLALSRIAAKREAGAPTPPSLRTIVARRAQAERLCILRV
jgi:hypothetical protein